ncbi:hypothetical protein K474DRAFT_1666650 [Panus rudis PR-1116 ss-1]|nr:hypothetical protein K474DRAFT_1666650 [Panus rudis PR-1116 ss-1]
MLAHSVLGLRSEKPDPFVCWACGIGASLGLFPLRRTIVLDPAFSYDQYFFIGFHIFLGSRLLVDAGINDKFIVVILTLDFALSDLFFFLFLFLFFLFVSIYLIVFLVFLITPRFVLTIIVITYLKLPFHLFLPVPVSFLQLIYLNVVLILPLGNYITEVRKSRNVLIRIFIPELIQYGIHHSQVRIVVRDLDYSRDSTTSTRLFSPVTIFSTLIIINTVAFLRLILTLCLPDGLVRVGRVLALPVRLQGCSIGRWTTNTPNIYHDMTRRNTSIRISSGNHRCTMNSPWLISNA